MSDFDDLVAWVKEIHHTQEESRHSHANLIREGTVEQVDGKKGYQVRLAEDDGKAVPSPWFPHPEQGGAFKTWRPLTKGQTVLVIAPGGDQRLAHIIPKGGFSDQNKQPSEKLDENVETYGKVRTTWKADSTEKKVGDKVTVSTTTDTHMAKTEKAEHRTGPDAVTSTAGGSKHTVNPSSVVADASLFRATKKVIMASG